ncbi:MAG: arsenate reductase (thioredoxin) [Bacillota bacterium]
MEKKAEKKSVLFLCTGNSARSQMAEGLLKNYGKGKFEVASAGTAPAGVNPNAIKVMQEIGIDISEQTSDEINQEMLDQADLLITLCGDARESCPVVPVRVEKKHWDLEDPARVEGNEKEVLAKFREIRDQIKKHVEELLKE